MLRKFLTVAVLFLLFACSDETPGPQSGQPQKTAPAVASAATPVSQPGSQVTAEADHFLVFFLDPNGGPCRMQNSILEGMADELKGKVNLRYVQTTVPDDLQYFYSYGIRGLPSLILADAGGKELKRLPPGVNPEEKVRELLQTIPN